MSIADLNLRVRVQIIRDPRNHSVVQRRYTLRLVQAKKRKVRERQRAEATAARERRRLVGGGEGLGARKGKKASGARRKSRKTATKIP